MVTAHPSSPTAITAVITTSQAQVIEGGFVFHSELLSEEKEKTQAGVPAFAHRNGRVSQEVTSQLSLIRVSFCRGSQNHCSCSPTRSYRISRRRSSFSCCKQQPKICLAREIPKS
jgi:hypothetical protein